MPKNPPKVFLKLLRWFCHPALLDTIEGDLHEFYYEKVNLHGKRKADLLFIREVILLFRRPILHPLGGWKTYNHIGMAQNYLKVTNRHLIKNQKYAIINILGLMIGICSSFILLKHVEYFISSDQEHLNKAHIYEVSQQKIKDGNESDFRKRTFFGLGPYAKDNYATVSKISRYITTIESRVLYEKPDGSVIKHNEHDISEADPDFIRMFSFDFVLGDPDHALDEPGSVILTESTAQRYFKDQPPMGKVLKTTAPWGTEYFLTVTGIIKDIPGNSTIKFDFLKSLYKKPNEKEEDWGYPGFRTFLYIDDIKQSDNLASDLSQRLSTMEVLSNEGTFNVALHSIDDVELTTSQQLILVISLLILVITWTNFANLYTAKSLTRAKEMAMRKVNGSSSWHTFYQFLTESFVIHILAIMGAFGLIVLSYPLFEAMTQGELLPYHQNAPELLLLFIAFIFIGALITAIYPALVIGKYKPLRILKKNIDLDSKHGLKLSVIIQFVLSAVLIISAWVIKDQMEYLQDKNLGYHTDHTLVISPSKDVWDNKLERFQSFKDQIRKYSEVEYVSSATSIPGRGGNGTFKSKLENTEEVHELTIMGVDVHFVQTMNLNLVAGMGFQTGQFHKNRRSVIVNQSAVKAYGLNNDEDIIGRKVRRSRVNKEEYVEVIGVVEDYHFASLKKEIGPLLLDCNPFRGHILIRLNSTAYDSHDRLTKTIDKVESVWNEVYDNQVFEVRFLDDEFNHSYRSEISLRRFFTVFTFVSIFLSSLGLIGLSMFAALRRKNEVGVRKVLGASVLNILTLFSKDFFRQILVAILISIPIAYYLMEKWLENYSYRTHLNVWSFIIPGVALLLISLLTVTGETLKSANMNPTKVLREE